MELWGTVEAVRDIEETLEIAKTKGRVLIGREGKKENPIQGDKFESAAFSRTYEVYPGKRVLNWEVSPSAFLDLILTKAIKVRFWYEYRHLDNRHKKGRVTVTEGSLNTLFKLIPGFARAFNKIRDENNKKGVDDDKVSKGKG